MEYNYFKNTWWWGDGLTITSSDGKAIATLSVTNDAPYCGFVSGLMVHESVRRRGRGRAMMQEVERQARMLGLDYIHLGARKASFVVEWYMRLGYYVSENNVEECPELMFTMIKDLK